jgi:hypothetical protein
MGFWLKQMQNRGLGFRLALLGASGLLIFAGVSPVAYHLGGSTSVAAATVAWALCLAGALVALWISHALRGPELALPALLVSIATRTGIPLVAGAIIHLQSKPLAEAGILYYLIVFYAVTLTVETVLSLPLCRQPTNPSQTSSTSNATR